MAEEINKKKPGRPKKRPDQNFEEVNEVTSDKLEMAKKLSLIHI